jgi:ADP-ribose pyrophosphatase
VTEANPGSAGASDAPAGSATPTDADADLVERVVETRTLHRGRYLDFRIETVERADGSRATRDIVGHPGAVAIVAVDEADRLLVVRQYRVPARAVLLELPAGTLDVDDDGRIEDPDLAARRELEEETGYRAGRWERVASFWTAPGFATELMHLYLADDLLPADDRLEPEDDERLELIRLPLDEAIAAVEHGAIADAKSLVGILWLARRRAAGGTGGAATVAAGGR